MQSVSCPSCGAPVEFRSHASVLAVCAWCQTTVLKGENDVKDLGKMSSVLEDYSPIQIGTSGKVGGRAFTVIGRIQLRYEAGLWNEWHVLYDDGATAWLGDSSGLYTMTDERRDPGAALPAFGQLVVGQSYPLCGASFTAAELREAECIGGQGELPFKVGGGWRIRVADFRSAGTFLTLDYSDGDQPKVYMGKAVTLAEMQCQWLREDEQIQAGAGQFRGKLGTLSCPACGGGIKYVPGATKHLVCPGCQTPVDAASPEARVLAAGERMAQVSTTLELGAQATINGARFDLIGLMRRLDEEHVGWTEYLLHNPKAGFLWLVETDEGWSRAKVQETWPKRGEDGAVRLGSEKYEKLFEYDATVSFAAGAFNWRVAVGDTVRVVEYKNGGTRLAAESNAQEMTWSQSTPVGADQIRAWFGPAIPADKQGQIDKQAGKLAPTGSAGGVRKFMWWIVGLNAPPLLFNFGNTWLVVALALAAVWLPYKYLESTAGEKR